MILTDFAKAVGQLSDRRFRKVLALGIGLTFALLIAIYAGLLWLIDRFVEGGVEIPLVGPVTWVGDLLGFGSFLLVIILSVFLMVPVASAITSLFLEDVADAVEAEHYAHLPAAPRTGFWDGLRDTVNFFGVLIAANIVALIAYALLPMFSPLIFYGLNGYLLGREYFILAAARREGRQEARAMMSENRTEVWFAGVLMALPLTIPLVNLLIPVLGAATFTHLYHRISSRG